MAFMSSSHVISRGIISRCVSNNLPENLNRQSKRAALQCSCIFRLSRGGICCTRYEREPPRANAEIRSIAAAWFLAIKWPNDAAMRSG
jgi:hypothetical protein